MGEKLASRRKVPPPLNSLVRVRHLFASTSPAPINENECTLQRDLQALVLKGDEEAIMVMVQHGMVWDQSLCPNKYKETPLHTAIRENNSELARKLLQVANLSGMKNLYGEQPLHLASRMGYPELVQAMLSKGADKNACDCEKCTPFFHAVSGSCTKCAKILIDAGCDMDAMSLEMISPLDHAIMYKDIPMINLLLRSGCTAERLHDRIIISHDPLHSSFFFNLWSRNCLDSMQLFLDCGYRMNKVEVRGLKRVCRQLNNLDVLKILCSATEEPAPLLYSCRQTIRRFLMERRHRDHTPMEAMVVELTLPQQVKDYLLVKESE